MQGHIHKRVRTTRDGKQVTSWYVVVDLNRGPDGRRRQKWHGGFRTRREAEAAKAKLVDELNGGTYIEASKTTFAEWVESSWLPTMRSQVKASTWDSYMRNLRLHVLPRIGHRPLAEVSAPMLNSLYAELLESGRRHGDGGGLSAKTVRYLHATIHKVLGDAIDAGLLQANPADRARAPKPRVAHRAEMHCWDAEQLAKFLAHIEGHRLQVAFHLAAMTGMRRGEVLGLRWDDVHFQTQTLSVRHTIISVAYEVRESTPKTHQARVIDLDAATLDLLRHQAIYQETERSTWGPGYQENDLVFRREDGSPVHPESFSDAFETAVERSGLPKIRLHDLRHGHATIALRAGVPVKVISERLGHENPAFTLTVRPRHPGHAGGGSRSHRLPGQPAHCPVLRATRCGACGAAGRQRPAARPVEAFRGASGASLPPLGHAGRAVASR